MSAYVRPPAVAGRFYPAEPEVLAALVDRLVAAGRPGPEPVGALVAPHAGYVYSGPIAGAAYARVAPRRGGITRVVLIGPCHYVPIAGLAVPSASGFATPLGVLALDAELRRRALAFPAVSLDDRAHVEEHSLEVQLPFLQRVLGDVRILPIVVADASPGEVADVLDAVWRAPETLLVVSSDLSHGCTQAIANARDRRTADAIVGRRANEVREQDACGAAAVRGLLELASRRGLEVRLVDLRTSADTAGQPERVVGYGAFEVPARPAGQAAHVSEVTTPMH